MIEWLSDPEIWLSLITLTTLEIILGVDNLVFIAILADRLPEHRRRAARRIGLGLALATRILLLFTLTWMISLTKPLFTAFGAMISGRDLILIGGGLFLTAKAVVEIHHRLEPSLGTTGAPAIGPMAKFAVIVIQIALLDMVFSLDSVLTAIGMVRDLPVMITAIVLAMILMLIAAEPLSRFINRHPTIMMLALSFLILIGVTLIADGLGFYIPKGYIYFSVAFAIFVETLNLLVRRRKAAARGPT